MKTFEKQAAQGDVLVTKVETLPTDMTLTKEEGEGKNFIVGHSETGHHHVVSAAYAQLYMTSMALVMYLVVQKATEMRHLRDDDTHEALLLEKGIYQIRNQREHTPEGWVRAID